MAKANWRDIAELIGIAAIVASLIFVGLELQQSQRIARADRQFQQIEREFGLNDLVAENIELIVKMNTRQKLTESEMILADRLVRTIWISHFFAASQVNLIDASGQSAAIRALAILLNDNPGLKTHYRSRISKLESEIELISGRGFGGFAEEFHSKVQRYISILEEKGEQDSTH